MEALITLYDYIDPETRQEVSLNPPADVLVEYTMTPYVYGADADGRRGVMMIDYEVLSMELFNPVAHATHGHCLAELRETARRIFEHEPDRFTRRTP